MNESKKPDRAVALRYDPQKDTAPSVVASGKGQVAANIIQKGREADVTVYEDAALASALSDLEIDQNIPAELYEAVAKVLVFIAQVDDYEPRQ